MREITLFCKNIAPLDTFFHKILVKIANDLFCDKFTLAWNCPPTKKYKYIISHLTLYLKYNIIWFNQNLTVAMHQWRACWQTIWHVYNNWNLQNITNRIKTHSHSNLQWQWWILPILNNFISGSIIPLWNNICWPFQCISLNTRINFQASKSSTTQKIYQIT